MKRTGGLFESFCSFENLWLAYRKAMKGSRVNVENAAFFMHLETELFQLQEELANETYSPQAYRFFQIHDPKERTISVAPFRDRVVHHALVNLLEPVYEKMFIFDSYATRKGKGTHAAVSRARAFLRQNEWFLKADVEKFFDSVDQNRLMQIIRRKIKDSKLLSVTEKIIRNGGKEGRGLPIGNLTSQFFANVYLNELDYFAKQELRVKHYLRYMDDFVLFHPDKEKLKSWRKAIEIFLEEELQLELKESAIFINRRQNGLTFLGKRIFPGIVRLAPANLQRMIKRLKQRETEWKRGLISEEKFLQSANSYWAQLNHYPTYQLRMKILQKKGRLT